jgi:hypothetical protein
VCHIQTASVLPFRLWLSTGASTKRDLTCRALFPANEIFLGDSQSSNDSRRSERPVPGKRFVPMCKRSRRLGTASGLRYKRNLCRHSRTVYSSFFVLIPPFTSPLFHQLTMHKFFAFFFACILLFTIVSATPALVMADVENRDSKLSLLLSTARSHY